MDSHSESTRAFCLKSSACLPGTSKAVDKLESPPTLAIVEYVAWFNNERLHEMLDDRPPREVEALYAANDKATIPIK